MTLRLAIVVAFSLVVAGCSDDAVDPSPAPASTSAGAAGPDDKSTEAPAELTSTPVTGPTTSESIPPVSPATKTSPSQTAVAEETAPPRVHPIRLLLLTEAVPVVCDFLFVLGDRSLEDVAVEAATALLKGISDQPNAPPKWDDVFRSPLLRLAGGMADSRPSLRQRALLQRTYDRDGSETAEPAELLAYVNRGMPGTGWFVLRVQQSAALARQDQTLVIVDVDQDGRLGLDETRLAAERIWRFDADGDGVVWRGDLSPIVNQAVVPNERPLRADQIPAVVIDDDSPWDDVYYRCEQRYAASGPLELDALGAAAAAMSPLDENEDGIVSRRELELLTSVEPHLVVACDFAVDRDGGSQPLSVDVKDASQSVSRQSPVSFAVAVAGARLNIGLQLPTDDRENTDLLSRIDINQDELISESELRVLGLPIRFDRYDEDESGSLDAAEFAALYELAAAAPNMRVECWLSDRQDAVFTSLDTNADQRLDRRELQSAADVLVAADANADGYIDAYELSSGMQIVIKRGAGPRAADVPSFPATSAAKTDAPPWFLQTDGNRDGLIDNNEFLGRPAQFRALDKNADGYIEPSETGP